MKSRFPIPDGVVEVTDEYELNLAHYELLNLRPRGTISFAGEKHEFSFQFFAGNTREEGIFARFDEQLSPPILRVFDHLSKFAKLECFVTITLLQFKLIFLADRAKIVHSIATQRTLNFDFPVKILKTHRRKFIRIPFNETFPAELRFQAADGKAMVRKLRDLSREGMRLRLEAGDEKLIGPGMRLKQAVLKVLNREMPVGLSVVSIDDSSVGIRVIAISETDKLWIRDCIRVLMKQILNLADPKFDDAGPVNKRK